MNLIQFKGLGIVLREWKVCVRESLGEGKKVRVRVVVSKKCRSDVIETGWN